ncbi:Mu transposase C-terminal domain-containing protein [Paenibacillus sp. MBLB4367]|uniref:Mu transposase C-terminal domain-containing protein n=1 Tax=Paenibacillus sp. MBLB4367 TaxID=3384767 RepID=UPI0039082AEA
MILAKNSVIQWNRGFDEKEILMQRVLWIDEKRDEIVLFSLADKEDGDEELPQFQALSEIQEALSAEQAVVRPIDPYVRRINSKDEQYKKHVAKRDETWKKIGNYLLDEPDIYVSKLRGAIIKEILEKKEKGLKTKKSIYRLFRKFWKYGKTEDALYPHFEEFGAPGKPRVITEEMLQKAKVEGKKIPKRGRPRFILEADPTQEGINIDERTERLILSFIKRFFYSQKKPSLPETYDAFLVEYYTIDKRINKDGLTVPILDPEGKYPSWDQFKSLHYKNRDVVSELKAREGTKLFNLNKREVLGSSTDNDQIGAGSVYQIDSTITSVHLVNRFDPSRNIGKATVYLVMDVLARKIVGRYVSVNDPSWMAVQMALYDAFSNANPAFHTDDPMEKICYLPECIVWDRAREQLGMASDHMAEAFAVILTNTASYRADWKGIIEQMFNQLRIKLRNIPGAVKKGYRERGEKDYREDAVVDIEEFTKYVDAIIAHHNNHIMVDYPMNETMLKDNILPTPNDLWDWGIKNGGALRQYSAQKVMFHLMPQKKASVTKGGLRIGNRYYTGRFAQDNGWFVRARNAAYEKIEVAYDKRNPNYIYFLLDDGKVERCELVEKDKFYQKYHEAEIDDIEKREKIKAKLQQKQQHESNAELKVYEKAMIEESTKKMELKNRERSGRGKRTENVNESKNEERTRRLAEEADRNSLILQNRIPNNPDIRFEEDDDEEFVPSLNKSALKKLMNR